MDTLDLALEDFKFTPQYQLPAPNPDDWAGNFVSKFASVRKLKLRIHDGVSLNLSFSNRGLLANHSKLGQVCPICLKLHLRLFTDILVHMSGNESLNI